MDDRELDLVQMPLFIYLPRYWREGHRNEEYRC